MPAPSPPRPGLPVAALALWGWGCAERGPLPPESLRLTGEGVEGFVAVEPGSGCTPGVARVGLWGPRWGTPDVVTATVTEPEPGQLWLELPLETGLGEGMGALRLQGGEARVPLGGRGREHEALLRAIPGPPPEHGGAPWLEAFRARITADQADWARGGFRLLDDGALVGELQLRGEEPPWVWVYDATWRTAGPVAAQLGTDGGDLLLAFEVQPRLEEEQALLRINVARRVAVVPLDAHPTPSDRWLTLEPGIVQADERAPRLAQAEEEAGRSEAAWVAAHVPGLARAARQPDGSCATPAEVDPAWPLLLRGYQVDLVTEGAACVVTLEPEVVQHTRRWQGVVGPDGVLDGGLLVLPD